MINASLFDFDDYPFQQSSDTIKIVLPDNLQEKWDEIFEDEYKKITSKIALDKTIKKSFLKKNALANFRRQMSTINITGTFHLDNKELFICGDKNRIKNNKIIFQKELMLLGEYDLDKIDEIIINNIYTLMRTAAFCTVLGG